MKKKQSFKRNPWFLGLAAILVGIASWQIYGLLNLAAEDVLVDMGITNEYAKGLVVLGVIVGLLVVVGFGLKRTVKKVMGMN